MAWCDVACPPHGRAPGRGSHRPLVVSDLRRARQTAQALASHHGLALRVEPLWREQSFGVLEGLDVPTIQRQHADLWSR